MAKRINPKHGVLTALAAETGISVPTIRLILLGRADSQEDIEVRRLAIEKHKCTYDEPTQFQG